MADEKRPDETSGDEQVSLNIVHHFPEDSRLTFSDNVAIQHTPTEFTITFAQVRQPLVATASEYDTMTTIRADVVARIVLTPAKMLEFIQSLQENWRLYGQRMKAIVEAKRNVDSTKVAENPASAD